MKNTLTKIIFYLILLTILMVILIAYFAIPKINLQEERTKETAFQQYMRPRIEQRNAVKKLYLTGHFNPTERTDFITIPEIYNIGGYTMYLRKETLNAFLQMANKAKQDGISLKIASATRNFNYQKSLWDNKWTGYTLVDGKDLSKTIPNGLDRFKKILEYSASPSTSRHHFGTDIDINNANSAYFDTKEGSKVYEWLIINAKDFGFCQPYNVKDINRPNGYNEEKWHWSYLPLARNFTQEYVKLIKVEDIKGFQGEEFVKDQDLISKYVLGINPECL